MLTLLASLLGFAGAAFPELLKLVRESADRRHELSVLDRQMELRKLGHSERLEEIRAESMALESQALYRTYSTGIHWVDALNGTVRPVVAYAFFLLYAAVKLLACAALSAEGNAPPVILYDLLWTPDDAAIFAGIISFYFGSRAMGKARTSS